VNASIWLLTAALAATGPADGQPCQTCQTCQSQSQQQVIYANPQPVTETPQRTGLFPALRARLENMRHHDQAKPVQGCASCGQVVAQSQQAPCASCGQVIAQSPQAPCASCGQQMAARPVYVQAVPIQQVMYARPMPVGPQAVKTETPEAETIVQASAQNEVIGEVSKEFQRKIGAADDYSWITGQLFYVHVDGGTWVLRYAAVDQEDKYGGSVVLAAAVDMKNYREGDLVSVTGEILSDNRATRHLGGPKYRAETISMIERADH
jgi:hypothetical protein